MRVLASQQEGDAGEQGPFPTQPSSSQVCWDTSGHRSLPIASLRFHFVLGLVELEFMFPEQPFQCCALQWELERC